MPDTRDILVASSRGCRARVGRVDDYVTMMLYEETAHVEFKLYPCSRRTWFVCDVWWVCICGTWRQWRQLRPSQQTRPPATSYPLCTHNTPGHPQFLTNTPSIPRRYRTPGSQRWAFSMTKQEGLAVANIARDDPLSAAAMFVGIVWWLQLRWLAQLLCSRHAPRLNALPSQTDGHWHRSISARCIYYISR